ncbi:aspartate-semialdehyde dehydrogenase [Candidatus Vidania fulgoroideorum]
MIKIALIADRGLVSEEFKNRSTKIIKKYKIKIINKNFFNNNNYLYKLLNFDIIVNCKDSEFSKNVYEKLKKIWKGYWLDFSSQYRMNKNSIICLDPVNKKEILKSFKKKRIFCGANCTSSIMIMSLIGLLKKFKILKIYCSTYQSISGEGYLGTKKMINNYKIISKKIKEKNILDYINKVYSFKKNNFLLNYSLIPKIGNFIKDKTEEEIKTEKEIVKILRKDIKVFSTCVRVNVLRCHSESIILKFKKDISKKKFKKHLCIKNSFVKIVSDDEVLKKLNPSYVSNKKFIYIGRIKKIEKKTFSIFVIGDQLIWGATEPIYRVLKLLINEIKKKN